MRLEINRRRELEVLPRLRSRRLDGIVRSVFNAMRQLKTHGSKKPACQLENHEERNTSPAMRDTWDYNSPTYELNLGKPKKN